MSKTIEFFKSIAKIPRESGNEKEITKFLEDFAKKRKLEYEIDEYNNLLIKKKTCNAKTLILQAHTDMVCVSSKEFDFAKNGITVLEKDGYLMANETTLGADNGIGVAQILNILDSDIPCNIEAVFTTSEETTMSGAQNFDAKKLTGKYMLNLDGFDENTIVLASAAYYDLVIDKSEEFVVSNYTNTYKVSISGLLGGHSGYDLDKGRGNAIILLAELLKTIKAEIVSIKGGSKNNVFPTSGEAIINANDNIEVEVKTFLNKCNKEYPNLNITVTKEKFVQNVLVKSNNTLEFLSDFPSKCLYYNSNNEPTSSVNLGVIDNYHLEVGMRSSKKNEAIEILKMLEDYVRKYGFTLKNTGYQPGFYSKESSLLIQKLIATCPYLPKANAKSLHITVEAGFFQDSIPDLEIAIISPNIKDAHSINERVSIESINMTDIWLENFIKSFSKN